MMKLVLISCLSRDKEKNTIFVGVLILMKNLISGNAIVQPTVRRLQCEATSSSAVYNTSNCSCPDTSLEVQFISTLPFTIQSLYTLSTVNASFHTVLGKY